jgi:hypothetical protein
MRVNFRFQLLGPSPYGNHESEGRKEIDPKLIGQSILTRIFEVVKVAPNYGPSRRPFVKLGMTRKSALKLKPRISSMKRPKPSLSFQAFQ